jgi:hypothetical protein
VIIEFPKRDIITQADLEAIFAVEANFDVMLELAYRRIAAGATIEPGALTMNMRNRPFRAVAEQERRAG